jgi:hypothetical protein
MLPIYYQISPNCAKLSSRIDCEKPPAPNISLMLTRLAGENAVVLCLPGRWRENGRQREPPGSIARGR